MTVFIQARLERNSMVKLLLRYTLPSVKYSCQKLYPEMDQASIPNSTLLEIWVTEHYIR